MREASDRPFRLAFASRPFAKVRSLVPYRRDSVILRRSSSCVSNEAFPESWLGAAVEGSHDVGASDWEPFQGGENG